MFRSALFVFALVALSASASAVAKTSISSLQQNEMPCPVNNTETAVSGVGAPTPGAAQSAVTATPGKVSNRSARQRWKALLPGTLKSAS